MLNLCRRSRTTQCSKLQATRMDIMAKRQKKALHQLELDAQHESKQPDQTIDDDPHPTDNPSKRPRRLTPEDHQMPYCQYCHNNYDPEILSKHIQRCTQKLKVLQQTTLPYKWLTLGTCVKILTDLQIRHLIEKENIHVTLLQETKRSTKRNLSQYQTYTRPPNLG
jgi:hypothetical protein